MTIDYILSLWIIAARFIERTVTFGVIGWAILVIVTFIYVRKARDFSPFNRIGKLVHGVARHTSNVVRGVRASRFYDPLRGLMKRDPTILMIIIFSVLVIFLSTQLLRYVTDAIFSLALSIQMIFAGFVFKGAWMLVGAVINAALIFLLSMMLFMFISYLFDFLHRLSRFARRFVNPLILVVERSGVPSTWSFFVLYIIVSILQQAFSGLFRGA